MSDDNDTGTTETRKNLNESADKARANVGITRGTGTRDQEKYDLKARGDDAEAAAAELDDLLAELEDRDVFQRVRDLQHTVEDADE
jgi:hypothetical protein